MYASMGPKVNGKIFAMFVKGSFVTELPKERVDDLVQRNRSLLRSRTRQTDEGVGRLGRC